MAGNDVTCTRNATSVDYATALASGNVCATGPGAYKKAQLGDTIYTETMTVTSQWNFARAITKTVTNGTCNFNYGGAPNFSQCITIEPAPDGSTLTFAVPGANVSQINACVSGLSIQNFTVNMTTYTESGTGDTLSNTALQVGSGDSTCGATPPHDDYFANATFGGQVGVVGGAIDTWIVNSVAQSTADLPWQLGGPGNNSTIAGVNHSGLVGVVFKGYNFANTDAGHHHMECIHMDYSGDHNTIAGSQFDNCPVFAIRVEAEGSGSTQNYQTNHLFENNFFDTGGVSGGLNFDCHDNGCTLTGNIARFNSFNASTFAPTNDCAQNGANTCTDNSNAFYGNLVGAGCPSSSAIFGLGWTTSYDVWSGSQAGICAGDSTSAYSTLISYVAPGASSYNLDLSRAQTATNFVPSSVAWPLSGGNIHGAPRSGSATTAGAR